VVRVLQSSEISRNMFRAPVPYNLNDMSHDTAMDMLRRVLAAGVNVNKVYIDTVGIAENYKRKLDSAFYGQGIEFVVEKKADAKYKVRVLANVKPWGTALRRLCRGGVMRKGGSKCLL
jgi:ribonuclease H2 subunit A